MSVAEKHILCVCVFVQCVQPAGLKVKKVISYLLPPPQRHSWGQCYRYVWDGLGSHCRRRLALQGRKTNTAHDSEETLWLCNNIRCINHVVQ